MRAEEKPNQKSEIDYHVNIDFVKLVKLASKL